MPVAVIAVAVIAPAATRALPSSLRAARVAAVAGFGVALSLSLLACGGGGGGLGAVNTMPRNASSKAMDHAERCDDGEVNSCRWLGIWYSIGGGGAHRKFEGRRFLRWGCDRGDRGSCTLLRAFEKNDAKGTAQAPRPAPRPAPTPAPAPAAPLVGTDGQLGGVAGDAPAGPAGGEGTGGGAAGANGDGSGGSAAGAGPCEAALPAEAAADVRETARRCDAGNMASCQQIGVWYLKGNGGKQRSADGVRWLKHACDRGHEVSCGVLEELKRRLQELKDQGKI